MLSSVNHPNILRYHRSWVEVDSNSDEGDGNSCGHNMPWHSPAAGSQATFPCISPPLQMASDSESSCSYDGGSCGSAGVIFEATEEEDPQEEEAPFSTTLMGSSEPGAKATGTDGHRAISSGWTAGSQANAEEPLSKEPGSLQAPDTATLYIQVELCR